MQTSRSYIILFLWFTSLSSYADPSPLVKESRVSFDADLFAEMATDIRTTYPKLGRKFPRRQVKAYVSGRGNERLLLRTYVPRLRNMPLRKCDYVDAKKREPVSIFFVSPFRIGLNIDDLRRIHPNHPLLYIGPPSICPQTLSEARSAIARNIDGVKDPTAVYAGSIADATAEQERLDAASDFSLPVLAKSKTFTALYVSRGRSSCNRTLVARIVASTGEAYATHADELQQLVRRLPLAHVGRCKRAVHTQEIHLFGHAQSSDPTILHFWATAKEEEDFRVSVSYTYDHQYQPNFACERNYSNQPERAFWQIQNALRTVVRTGVLANPDATYRKPYAAPGYKTYVQVLELCDDSPFQGTAVRDGTLLEYMVVNGRRVSLNQETAPLVRSLSSHMLDENIAKRQGRTVFVTGTTPNRRSEQVEVRLRFNEARYAARIEEKASKRRQLEQRVLGVIARTQQQLKRETELSTSGTRAAPRKMRVPQDTQPLLPFGTIDIAPQAYLMPSFLSGGQEYSLDAVVMAYNGRYLDAYLDRAFSRRDWSASSTDGNGRAIVFRDDRGEVFVANVAHGVRSLKEQYRPHFSVRRLEPAAIEGLKTLLDAKQATNGRIAIRDAELSRRESIRVIAALSDAFHLLMGGQSSASYDAERLLEIQSDQVPALQALVAQYGDRRSYFERMTTFEGRADRFLVPLPSYVQPSTRPIAPFFTPSGLFIADADATAEYTAWTQRLRKSWIEKSGALYKPPEYWTSIGLDDYQRYFDGMYEVTGQWRSERVLDTIALYYSHKFELCRSEFKRPPMVFEKKIVETTTRSGLSSSRVVDRNTFYVDRRYAPDFGEVLAELEKRETRSPSLLELIRNPSLPAEQAAAVRAYVDQIDAGARRIHPESRMRQPRTQAV